MRAFSEMDLFQVVSIKEKIMAGEASQSDLGDIETETFMKSIFREETFFSLFAEQKGLYDLIYQRLKEPSQDQSSSFLNENTTRIMKFILRRPTPVRVKDDNNQSAIGTKRFEHITDMSLLRQCLLFTNTKAMESTFRMARLAMPYLTDYIKSIDDLELIV